MTKYFPEFRIQTFIDIQFGLIGTIAVGHLISPFLKRIPLLPSRAIPLPEWLVQKEDTDLVHITTADILGAVIGVACVLVDVSTGHHLHTLNNLLACSLAIEVMQVASLLKRCLLKYRFYQGVSIKSFKAASTLLVGLLIYDVFWVFSSPSVIGENVMLKVATSNSLEGPLKLILPNGNASGEFPFSVLGLGDIAVPGFLAALLLRFDIFRGGGGGLSRDASISDSASQDDNTRSSQTVESMPLHLSDAKASTVEEGDSDSAVPERERSDGDVTAGSKTYFLPVLAAYLIGLLSASGANAITHQGQPALLYIVPCMLLTASSVALMRGEFWNRLLAYNDPKPDTLQGTQYRDNSN